MDTKDAPAGDASNQSLQSPGPWRPADEHLSTTSIPDWRNALSSRLCVHPDAWDGWAAIHDKPCQVFCWSMSAGFFALIVNTANLAVISKAVGWIIFGPCLVYCTCHLSALILAWRHGPMISRAKKHRALIITMSVCLVWTGVRMTTWPGSYIPFGSHLLYTLLVGIGTGALIFSSVLGLWSADHPPQPYTSFQVPLFTTAVRLLRIMDSLTDMLVVKMMLAKAQEPCYWFGEEHACWRWRVMAACAGVSAALDLSISVLLAFAGMSFQRGDIDQGKRRTLLRAHVAAFSCEVSILAVTLVKLFCDFREPAAATSAAQRRNAVTLTLGSFAVTVASFCLTMLGMKTVLTAVNRVSVQLRGRLSRASVHSHHCAAPTRCQDAKGAPVSGTPV